MAYCVLFCISYLQAEARFLQTEAYPGDQVGMEISAAAGSLCALGVVDKSVQAIQTATTITSDKVCMNYPNECTFCVLFKNINST